MSSDRRTCFARQAQKNGQRIKPQTVAHVFQLAKTDATESAAGQYVFYLHRVNTETLVNPALGK
jgi:hypothetical protein